MVSCAQHPQLLIHDRYRQTDMEDTMALRVPQAELTTGPSESLIKQLS